MLSNSRVHANVPAADLQRARRFYTDTLGLSVTAERDGLLVFTTDGGTTFFVYETEYAGQAGHTIAQVHVDDLDADVKELQDKGVVFEHYDLPGVSWSGGIASIPEMGRAAWFKDSEGNIMCLDDMPNG
jgi:predicted enzyme related to lactoylglutathione lyase